MKYTTTILMLLVALISSAQQQIDPDWILVGKSYNEFKQFTKNNDLDRPQLKGGKASGDTTFTMTFSDNTYEKIVVNNKYEYLERSVTWLFVNDTIVSQVFNKLNESIITELNDVYGESSKTSGSNYSWTKDKIELHLIKMGFNYLMITDKSERSFKEGESIINRFVSNGIR